MLAHGPLGDSFAGTYGGRFIHGMDRRITNRNLCVFGGEGIFVSRCRPSDLMALADGDGVAGELLDVRCPKAEMKRGPGSGAGARFQSGDGHSQAPHEQ